MQVCTHKSKMTLTRNEKRSWIQRVLLSPFPESFIKICAELFGLIYIHTDKESNATKKHILINTSFTRHKFVSYLCKHGIQVGAGVGICSLSEVDLHLFTHLFLVQVPTVVIMDRSPCSGVRSTCQPKERKLLV